MKLFENYLKEKLKNKEFAKNYNEELVLTRLAVQIAKRREEQKLTQKQLADKAHLTQQQVSKVESASGLSVKTLTKVCSALNLNLTLSPG